MKTVTRRVVKPDPIQALAVNRTATHFGYSPSYIYKIIGSTRERDDIKKFYNELYSKISKATAI